MTLVVIGAMALLSCANGITAWY